MIWAPHEFGVRQKKHVVNIFGRPDPTFIWFTDNGNKSILFILFFLSKKSVPSLIFVLISLWGGAGSIFQGHVRQGADGFVRQVGQPV